MPLYCTNPGEASRPPEMRAWRILDGSGPHSWQASTPQGSLSDPPRMTTGADALPSIR